EALNRQAIDMIVASPEKFLEKVKGRRVILDGGDEVELPASFEIVDIPSTWKEDFLNTLVNPNLVYILLALGMWGLIYEFSEPGLGLGAAVGGTCLLFALYGLSVLPVNYAGLGLLILGLILMVLDIFVPSYGVLSLGGVTSFVLGSVMLFETEVFSVSIGLVIGITGATLVFILVAGYLVLSNWDRPPVSGDDAFMGAVGVVKKELNPRGMIYVRGEIWQAESKSGETVEVGAEVKVTDKDRTRLIVEKDG
ncbi:MAG: NfeD family protein, partial [bacterium]